MVDGPLHILSKPLYLSTQVEVKTDMRVIYSRYNAAVYKVGSLRGGDHSVGGMARPARSR